MLTKIKLTKEQEKDLLNIKRNSHSEIIRDRAHAVLLRNKDKTMENIAEALLRSLDFVVQSIQRFKKGELENLALTGHNHKLSSKKRKNIIDLIKNKAPNELKGLNLKSQFWTTDILRLVIKRKYGVAYKGLSPNAVFGLNFQILVNFYLKFSRQYYYIASKIL